MAIPQLRVAGIIGKLAIVGMGSYLAYNTNLKTALPEMLEDTNQAYRQALQDRFKIIWLEKGSPKAKQIDEDVLDSSVNPEIYPKPANLLNEN